MLLFTQFPFDILPPFPPLFKDAIIKSFKLQYVSADAEPELFTNLDIDKVSIIYKFA